MSAHTPGHIRPTTWRPNRRISDLYRAISDQRTLCGAAITEWDMTYTDGKRAVGMKDFPVCAACAAIARETGRS